MDVQQSLPMLVNSLLLKFSVVKCYSHLKSLLNQVVSNSLMKSSLSLPSFEYSASNGSNGHNNTLVFRRNVKCTFSLCEELLDQTRRDFISSVFYLHLRFENNDHILNMIVKLQFRNYKPYGLIFIMIFYHHTFYLLRICKKMIQNKLVQI